MNPHFADLPALGIDVSKRTFDVCLLRGDGSKATAQFSNDHKGFARLKGWLHTRRVSKALCGMEATGPYGVSLLWELHCQGHTVCQLNARRVKDYVKSQGRRAQTDRTDAMLIAGYLKATERLVAWEPPSEALRQLQALVRRREDLLVAQQAEKNRMEGKLDKIIKASIDSHLEHLKAALRAIDQAIERHVLEHAELQKSVRLLCSIDGIGPVVSHTILAEVPAISAFARARDVAAFAGLTPCFKISGTSVRRLGHMSREGSALLRKKLYMAAMQAAKRSDNAFHQCYMAFLKRGKTEMCALGAIMHKLMRVAFGVLKHQTPFAENLARI